MKKQSLDEIKDKHLGKVGTPRRDAYEKDLINEINKQTMKREKLIEKIEKIWVNTEQAFDESLNAIADFLESEIKKAKKKAKKKARAKWEQLMRDTEELRETNRQRNKEVDDLLEELNSKIQHVKEISEKLAESKIFNTKLNGLSPEAEKTMQILAEEIKLPNQQESSELPKVGDYYEDRETGIVYQITDSDTFSIKGRGVYKENEGFSYSDLKTFLKVFEKVETDDAPKQQEQALPKVGEVWKNNIDGTCTISTIEGDWISYVVKSSNDAPEKVGQIIRMKLFSFLKNFTKAQDAPKQKPSLEYVKKDLETLKTDTIDKIYGLKATDAIAQLEAIIKYIEEN